MPRRKLIRSDFYPYHLTGRTNNREHFPIPLDIVWSIFEREAHAIQAIYGSEIQSLVLMPNHYHMIATFPEFDVGRVMNFFLANVSRAINAVSGRIGHVFGGPYYWTLIDNRRYYGHGFKYVYRNPVRAGLCNAVQDYPFSTLCGRLGETRLAFPLLYTRPGMEYHLPSCDAVDSWLEWLNTPFSTEAERLIQYGLRRKKFEVPVDRATRKRITTLDELL